MTVQDNPTLNATLNGIATVLLTTGYILIKQGRREAHRKVMTAACIVSAVFLVTYVTHKVLIHGVNTPFGGIGAIRSFYYTMLISHILLAMSIAYLVPRTFLLATKGDIIRHQAWAKWTFPIWYYVSVTGVLVYFFLYQWWPAKSVV
jgi:putative membrane protein